MPRFTEILLGGKPKRLRYDFNALADLEAKAGAGIGALMSEERVGLNTMRLLIWAGLKHEDRTLTPEKVGDMLQTLMEGGMELSVPMAAVTKALQQSGIIAKPGDDEEGNEGNAKTEAAK